MTKSVIFGISGTKLTAAEKDFFKQNQPLGFILFARNIENPEQVRVLTKELRESVEHEYVPIMIDQEGGRVSRLAPPNFRPIQKSASYFGELALTQLERAKELVFINHYLIGKELSSLGINVDCAPVADLSWEITHEVIGERSFGNLPGIVSELCYSAYLGLKAAGVEPIIKHIPGHGRATVDSHLDLPRIDARLSDLEETDFIPFTALPMFKWAMTAHIVYNALDSENPVTMSNKALNYIRNTIGYKNVLITDDINMKALTGALSEITTKCYDAGCDVILHCSGKLDEMKEIAPYLRELSPSIYGNIVPRDSIIYEEKMAKYLQSSERELEDILSAANC